MYSSCVVLIPQAKKHTVDWTFWTLITLGLLKGYTLDFCYYEIMSMKI